MTRKTKGQLVREVEEKRLRGTGNLTDSEIRWLLDLKFGKGKATVRAQLWFHYLGLKAEDKELAKALEEKLSEVKGKIFENKALENTLTEDDVKAYCRILYQFFGNRFSLSFEGKEYSKNDRAISNPKIVYVD